MSIVVYILRLLESGSSGADCRCQGREQRLRRAAGRADRSRGRGDSVSFPPTGPLYLRIFEVDGISVYRYEKGEYREEQPKRAYKLAVRRNALGDSVVGGESDSSLPPAEYPAAFFPNRL